MAAPARSLVVAASLTCCACAATAQAGGALPSSAPVDAEPSCVSAAWHRSDDAGSVTVSADNACGHPLTCGAHLAFATLAGPDLYLDCHDRFLPDGPTEALCRWPGQPPTVRGSGVVVCR